MLHILKEMSSKAQTMPNAVAKDYAKNHTKIKIIPSTKPNSSAKMLELVPNTMTKDYA